MPVIKVNDKRYSLRPGANRLGAGADVDVRVDEDPALGVQAIVEVESDEQVVIRPAADALAILVNGVVLAEPRPLIHGDKLEIAGTKLSYSVEKKAGKTQHLSAGDIAALAPTLPTPGRGTQATGGRIVSLVDGREYLIPASGITIGRDSSSGIVVAQDEVSRQHAKIAPGRSGYTIRDFSANGVKVNGVRIKASHLLSRSDVIKIGTEEFRFYADVESSATTKGSGTPSQGGAKVIVNTKLVKDSGLHAALPRRRGIPAWIWIVLFAADAAALYFLLNR